MNKSVLSSLKHLPGSLSCVVSRQTSSPVPRGASFAAGMQRWQANALQAVVLGTLVFIASKDVERTMRQQPVTVEQNAALQQHLNELRKKQQ